MNVLTKSFRVFDKKISFIVILWMSFAAVGALLKIRLGPGVFGDYIIYRNAFWHEFHKINLYRLYPSEKVGWYLYGPLFAVVAAPFAVLPINPGAFLWCISNAAVLIFAIRRLPVNYKKQQQILLICLVEMMTCIENMEVNCLIASL